MADAIIATVTAIEGTAYARSEEGELRELRVGDKLRQGETLVTPEGSEVELELADGQTIAIADIPEVALDADMLAEAAATAEEAALQDATLDEVIAAIEGDGDLSELLEAPGAGGADSNAGSSFIRLSRITEDTPEFEALREFSAAEPDLTVDQGEGIPGADAIDDVAETQQGSPITVPVLANDDLVEGAIITAVSNPANGTAAINADGTVTYTPNADFSGADSFTYTVVTPDGNATDTASVSVNVIADAPPPPPPPASLPEVSVGDATVTEGGTAQVNLTLSAPSDQPVTVAINSSDGTATLAGGDYDEVSGTVTFAPGETVATVSVTTNADALQEGTESLNLTLSNPANAVLGDGQGVVEIVDNFTPTISIDDVTVTEGNAAVLTLTLSAAVDSPVSVGFATADGSATSGADYEPNSGTVTFAPGQTSTTVTIQTNADDIEEELENGLVRLSSPEGATIADPEGVFSIVDGTEPPSPPPPPPPEPPPPPLPTATLSIAPVAGDDVISVGEVDGVISLAVTGSVGADVQAGDPISIVFGDGSTFDTVVNPDGVSYTVTVPVETILTNDTVTGTVSGQDEFGQPYSATASRDYEIDIPQQVISITDETEVEGTDLVFGVELSPLSAYADAGTHSLALTDVTTSPGDYGAVSFSDGVTDNGDGTITIPAGVTAFSLTVAGAADEIREDDETFEVNIDGVEGATGTGTILDDDTDPAITVDDVTVNETDGTLTFTLTKTGTTELESSVDYVINPGTATTPADYGASDALSGTITFAADETSRTVTVAIVDDAIDEADEQFTIDLSNPVNATTEARGVGTIIDNDDAPALSISDVTVNEGETATFTVTLTGQTDSEVSVNLGTADGTAVALADGAGDYDAATGTLTFTADPTATSRTLTFEVDTNDDAIDETDETFTVSLSEPANATITDGEGVGTIIDNDAAPTLSINDVTVNEGETASFTVTLSGQTDGEVTVDLGTADGTAIALVDGEGDYDAATGTLTFTADPEATSRTLTFEVATNEDSALEPDETFTVDLSNASGATIADPQGVGTIVDNDDAPTVAVNDVTVNESDGTLTFTLTKTGETALDGSVDYVINPGTATTPADYGSSDPLSGTVAFAAGETSKTVTVAIVDDSIDELDEQFTIDLANPVNLGIADDQGVGTILDNDEAPQLGISDVTVPEGDTASFTVTLNGQTDREVSVDLVTADGTAVALAAGQGDYDAATGTLTFAADPAATSRTLTFDVATNDDATLEPNETFTVTLSEPANAVIADGEGVGTIVDNDGAPQVIVDDVTVNEGDGTLSFTLTKTGETALDGSVDYTINPGTATTPADYGASDPLTGTVNFAAGETSKTVTVAIVDDSIDELDEQFTIDLDNAVNLSIADAQGVGTILDNDDAPTLSIDDVTVDEGGLATFTVTLAGQTDREVTVDLGTADGTAVALTDGNGDYDDETGTLTFPADPSATSRTLSFSVQTNEDAINELDETFTVNLSNASNATIEDSQGVGTILDDDLPTADDAEAATEDETLGNDGGSLAFDLGTDSAVTFAASYDGGLGAASQSSSGGVTTIASDSGVWTLTINESTGTYNFNQLLPYAHDAGADSDSAEVTVTLTDNGGNDVTSTLTLSIGDDGPTANPDTASLSEGGTVIGNVVDDANAASDDSAGADGFAAAGSVVGVAAGSNTAVPVSGGVGTEITGSHGKLTLGDTGSYSYEANASVAAGQTDSFIYTVEDADGDTSTTTLTFTFSGDNNAPTAQNGAAQTEDEGPRSDSGSLNFSLGDDTPVGFSATYTDQGLGPATRIIGSGETSFRANDGSWTVTVNHTTGAYTFTQNAAFEHAASSDLAQGVVNITLSDNDGSTATSQLSLAIGDDGPTAVSDGNLATFEEDVSNQTLGPISLLTGDDDFGADGAGAPSVTIGAGSLGGTVTISGGNLVYTNTAHNVQAGDTDVETFSYTIRDSDGDTSTATFTVSLTDGGVVMGDATDLTADDDDASNPRSPGNPGGADDDAQVLTGTVGYTLNDPLDSITLTANPTGLVTHDGSAVQTSFSGGVLTGYQAGGSPTVAADQVFTITLGTPGASSVGYTMALLQPVRHADGNDENNTSFDVTVQVTENDGSTGSTSFTVNIDDDTPIASLADGEFGNGQQEFFLPPTLAVDETASAQPNPEDNLADRSSQADLSAYFLNDTDSSTATDSDDVRFGADGAGSVSYGLSLTTDSGSTTVGSGGIESGLYAVDMTNGGQGDQIRLYDNGGTLEGRTGGASGTLYFTIAVDSSGTAELTQASGIAIWHPVDGDPDDVVYLDGRGDTGSEGTIDYQINLTQTVTDADGDSDSITVDLTQAIETGDLQGTVHTFGFGDDGPSATALGSTNVNEGETATGTLTFAGGADGATVTAVDGETLVFDANDANYSQSIDIGSGSIKVKADGSYSFTAENPAAGVASTTFTVTDSDGDTATANIAFNVVDANVPTARTSAAAVDDDGLFGGNAASTVGDLEADDDDTGAGLGDEKIFVGTLNLDFGGDGAGSVDFEDMDGTTATVGLETVGLSWDGTTLTATIDGGDRNNEVLFTVTMTNASTGAYRVDLLQNVLHAGGPNNEATDATVALTYTVTDSDGSEANPQGTLTITFDDDAPTASDDGNLATVSEGATGVHVGTVAALLLNDSFGADGEASADITIADGNKGGTLVIDGGNLLYSNAMDVAAGATETETFEYTITDADGDTSSAEFSVTVEGDNTPPLADPVLTDSLRFGASDTLPTGVSVANPVLFRSFTVNGTVDDSEEDSVALTNPSVREPQGQEAAPNLGGEDAESALADLVFQIDSLPSYGSLYVDKESDGTFTLLQPSDIGTAAAEFTSSSEFYWVAGETALDLTTGSAPAGITATQFDGSPGTVTATSGGIGVASTPAGQGQVPDQLGYRDGNSEAITADFGGPVTDATIDINRLIRNEGEVGQVEAFCEGELVGRWTFTGAEGRTLFGEAIDFSIGGNSGSFTINGIVFDSLRFTATEYADGFSTPGDSSDYFVEAIAYTALDDAAFTYSVRDEDGNQSDSERVVIETDFVKPPPLDDVQPVAEDDEDSAEEGGSTVTGNVISNDTLGDTPTPVTAASQDGSAITLGQPFTTTAGGSLTLESNGSYSYTPPQGQVPPAGLEETFSYTITDADGDEDTADLTITVTNADSIPTAGSSSVTLDDEGLSGGIAGDGGTASGADTDVTGEAFTFSGTLDLDFGADGAGAVGFAAMDGEMATVGQETVTYAWDNANKTLTATITTSIDGTRENSTLFTVEVTDPTTGAYTVTLVDNVLHDTLDGDVGNDTENPNDADPAVALSYTVTDADNSVAQADGTLTITFDDDRPRAGSFAALTVDNDANASDGGSNSGFLPGADGWGEIGLTGPTIPGVVYTETVDGNTGAVTLTAREDVAQGTGDDLFTLSLTPDGDYTFTLLKPEAGTTTLVDSFATTGASQPMTSVDFEGVTATPSGTNSEINPSNQGLSGDGNDLKIGEAITFDFDGTSTQADQLVFQLKDESQNGATFNYRYLDSSGNELSSGSVTADSAEQLTIDAPNGGFDKIELEVVTSPAALKIQSLSTVELVAAPGAQLAFQATGTDGDGDSVSGDIVVNIDGDQGPPALNVPPTIDDASTRVSEEGLADGIADTEGNSDTTNMKTSSGTLALGDADGDSLTVTFSGDLPADGAYTSGGVDVAFARSADNKTVTATANGATVLVATVADSGAYTTELFASFDHPDTSGEDELGIDLGVAVSDGADTTPGTLTVIVEDDQPESTQLSESLDVPVSVVDVDDVDANWTQIEPDSGISIDNDGSDGTVGLRWGSGSPQSGYDFDLNDATVNIDQLFSVGTLTHLNFPISGKVLDEVELNVTFDVVVDGAITPVSTTVRLDHDETGNDAVPEDNPANDDFISITNPGGTTQTINVGDRTFEFRVAGFLDGPNGDLVSSVQTTEGESTAFSLWAEIQSTDDLPELDASVGGSLGQDGSGGVSWDDNGTEISSGQIVGTYGTLTVNAGGSYIYEMDRATRDSVDVGEKLTDSFTWFLTDADGDRVASTLDIDLTGVANSDEPIALDLDGDGVEYLSRQAGVVFVDEATGQAVNTAWVAGDDGLLVVDANDSGTVDESREYVFTEWSETAETDMQAVAEVFDSNENRMLDPGDEAWSQFAIWQDANSDGKTDEGEMVFLDQLGVDSIALNYNEESEAGNAADGDVIIHGQSTVTWTDGRSSIAEDTSFAVDPLDLRDLVGSVDENDLSAYLDVSYDGANTVVKVSSSGGFTGAEGDASLVDQVFTFEGMNLVADLNGPDAIQAMIDAAKMNVDQ